MHTQKYVKRSDMGKVVRPVFIQGKKMVDHTAKTQNASVFFFKLENRVYACTCGHVIRKKEESKGSETIYLRSGNKTLSLGYADHHLQTPIPNNGFHFAHSSDEKNIDLAFLYIKKTDVLNFIESEYVILDFDVPAPDLAEFSEFYAFGWGNDHKGETIDIVNTPQLCCTLPKHTLNSWDNNLSFHANLNSDHIFSLSGMSGGLIMGRIKKSDELAPVGIIYEGFPTEEGKKDTNSFLNKPNMVHLNGYKISPYFLKSCLYNYDLSAIEKESCEPIQSYSTIVLHNKRTFVILPLFFPKIKHI